MCRRGGLLKILEGLGQPAVGGFDLHQKPRLTVFHYGKVDLPAHIVPEIVQRELTESHIGPEVHGLVEVGGHEVLDASPLLRCEAPVPEVLR